MWIVVVLLVVAVGALWVVSERRHARVRRRLRELTREVREAGARGERVERRVYEGLAGEALRGAGRGVGRGAAPPVRFLAQHGEDAFLWELFEGRLGGYYVEAGAYDGVTISATYALEAAGWTGLLVEPMPSRYEACRAARPGSRVVRAAVGARGAGWRTSRRRSRWERSSGRWGRGAGRGWSGSRCR